ncbi:dihydrofolate reductase-like domain-containing protein [Mariannaea sp. PMI_226]|nr:dihydrofolate reductase-like domain-containing protein [Mariannaea sp. PMI_226]
MQPLELTLIVAATRNMGIGFQGTMPWTGLRKEMQYFARVTTRIPPQAPPSGAAPSAATVNAVIMGRKTWDSIPAKFRPLKDRLNIVISRSAAGTLPPLDLDPRAEPARVSSLEAALKYARARSDVARVFVIGGAQIYDAALKLPEARRVLLTSIQRDFECDTFFPLKLGDPSVTNWAQKSRDDLQSWTGQEIAEHGQEEAGTRYEFQMWEKTE